MASWPTALDVFTSPGPTLDASPRHSDLHIELSTRLAVVQQTLGINPQAGHASVDARLDAIELTSVAGPWADYNANPQNVSTGAGSVVARYQRIDGYTCGVHLEFRFGAGGAITGAITASVPYAPRTGTQWTGSLVAVRFGTGPRFGSVYVLSDQVIRFACITPSGLWDGNAAGISQGTSGDVVSCDLRFETQSPMP